MSQGFVCSVGSVSTCEADKKNPDPLHEAALYFTFIRTMMIKTPKHTAIEKFITYCCLHLLLAPNDYVASSKHKKCSIRISYQYLNSATSQHQEIKHNEIYTLYVADSVH